MPVLPANDVKLTANTVLVVKGARLDMSSHHQVEGGVGRLVRIVNFEIVAAKSEHILGVLPTLHHLLLKDFPAYVYLFLLASHIVVSEAVPK